MTADIKISPPPSALAAATVALADTQTMLDVVRAAYTVLPDPCGLLGDRPFTIHELRMVHEAVIGRPLQKDTFRRAMIDYLTPTEHIRSHAVGKPARLFVKAVAA